MVVPDPGLDNVLILDCPSDTAADQRDDKHVYVSLAGRYSLASSTSGEPRQFACRAVNISAYEVALAAPVIGKPGILVVANIEQLGQVKGLILREFKLGFAMSVMANAQERQLLATRIDWIERNRHFEVIDSRAHARFIPRCPLFLLTLADGSLLTCFVIDISVSGAAISADITPKLGTVLAVGKVVGRVTRHLPGGFAVKFVEMQDRQEVETLVIRR
jgi:hypothetical protein